MFFLALYIIMNTSDYQSQENSLLSETDDYDQFVNSLQVVVQILFAFVIICLLMPLVLILTFIIIGSLMGLWLRVAVNHDEIN